MRQKLLKTINIVFILLMIGTFFSGGLWYYFTSLQWQNDDPQIGYVVGFITLCYFGFFMLVGETVLWRNIVYFVSTPSHSAIEKIGRILLIFLSSFEWIGGIYALCLPDSSLALIDLLTLAMLWISALQLLCQAMIWVAKWAVCRKQTARK